MRLAMVALTLLAVPVLSAAAEESSGTTPAHYVVFELATDGSVTPVFATRVALSRPPGGASATVASLAARDRDVVRVQVQAADGALAFAGAVAVPRLLRGESPGAAQSDGTYAIESHLVVPARRAFVVRVPAERAARLVLDTPLLARRAELRLDAMASAVSAPQGAPRVLVRNGDPANRVDLLVVGDGYTAGEQAKFEADAQQLTDELLGTPPFAEYRDFFNVATLFVASNQSGADQPPYQEGCALQGRVQTCCGDRTALPETPVTVDTAFDAAFCSYNSQRNVTVDEVKLFAAAAAVPDWDQIIALVNAPSYGGVTIGPLAQVSVGGVEAGVVQHEYGHAFAGLADEYDYGIENEEDEEFFPPCSDVVPIGLPCEPNVTDATSRFALKWRRWIDPLQPVPSFDPPPVPTDAGLWQGARYKKVGVYRQGFSCLMQILRAPFCDVAAEAVAMRFYQGGWGVPEFGIDAIEPGSEVPPPGVVHVPEGGAVFAARLLGPAGGAALHAEWHVDGELAAAEDVASGATVSFPFTAPTGSQALALIVTDRSPILHDDVRGSLVSTRLWGVTAGATSCGDADDNGGVTVTDGVQTLRAAAGLPTVCVPARCDLDGSGAVSVSDGVNVLRGAAGLARVANCPR